MTTRHLIWIAIVVVVVVVAAAFLTRSRPAPPGQASPHAINQSP